MEKIQMVDLTSQYCAIQPEIDEAVLNVLSSGQYINGEAVRVFCNELGKKTGASHVVPCANGTDALQIALMALNLKEGDEVIVPAFTYAAAIEAIVLLDLVPVLVDVDPLTYNIDPQLIESATTSRTKALIAVHLFGQSCDMQPILKSCERNGIVVIEDNAQSIGAYYTFPDETVKQTGTIGDIGTLSFFPTKNLACYGDGGAILTQNEALAQTMRMIASHGQSSKYIHDLVGCNSRLDTLQAAILSVKLKQLDGYTQARREAAALYDQQLEGMDWIVCPHCIPQSSHVYHQYTIQVKSGKRDGLQAYLHSKGIPSVVYYPKPMHEQDAYKYKIHRGSNLHISTLLCKEVLSLPMHTELKPEQIEYITSQIKRYDRL